MSPIRETSVIPNKFTSLIVLPVVQMTPTQLLRADTPLGQFAYLTAARVFEQLSR